MKNSEIIVLVNRCLNGDKESYNAIVRCFQRKVADVCFHFLGTRQDAEDAAVDIFVKAYRSLAGYNSQYAFSTWLLRIAVNHALGILRRRKIEKEYWLAETANPGATIDAKTPDTIFFADNRQQTLDNALKSLPDKYRTALLLKYQQDLSYQEISDIMEIPVNSVGSLILRGKKELREKLHVKPREVSS